MRSLDIGGSRDGRKLFYFSLARRMTFPIMGCAGLVLAAQISLGAGLGGIQPLGWPHPSKHTGRADESQSVHLSRLRCPAVAGHTRSPRMCVGCSLPPAAPPPPRSPAGTSVPCPALHTQHAHGARLCWVPAPLPGEQETHRHCQGLGTPLCSQGLPVPHVKVTEMEGRRGQYPAQW